MSIVNIYSRLPVALRELLANIYARRLHRRRFGGEFGKLLEFLEDSQYWNQERLMIFQIERLREVITDSYENVPHFRKLFRDIDLRPSDVTSLEILKEIPVMTKDMIRSDPRSFASDNIKRIKTIKDFSSGTTGAKLEFFLPLSLYRLNFAALWRFYGWAGVHLGEKRVTLGARVIGERLPYWIYNKSENQLLMSIHHLNSNTISSYIEKLMEFEPVFIQGHPTGIEILADEMLRRREKLKVKAVFTTAETLIDTARDKIENAFGCKVFESYGVSECVVAAFECEKHNGLHEATEYGITELESSGEEGFYSVIGTSLWNNAMPFIRYKIEDLVVPCEKAICSCGRTLPLVIKKVIGRIDDIVYDAQGNPVLPVTIRMHLKPLLKPFQNYQLIQTDKGEYEFKLTITEEKPTGAFIKMLSKLLGDNAAIKISEVTKIEATGGKIRNVVNRCSRTERRI